VVHCFAETGVYYFLFPVCMNTNAIIAIIVVIILAVGAYFLFMKPAATPAPTPTPTDTTAVATTSDTSAPATGENSAGLSASVSVGAPVVVNYTSSGFSPKSVTIKRGQAVTFVNKSGASMWVASNEHPNHTDYDGTSRTTHCAAGYTGPAPFDECGAGNSFTFTFDKAGSFPYHNHAGPEDTGMVVVTQ
jgi:plastocyanin